MTARPPLLDRGAETDALQRLTADAARGVGGVVVLEGPAGIGKTALVRLAGELAAERDLRSLRATGSELETGFPFGVARQLLERALDELSEKDRSRSLWGTAALAARVLSIRACPPRARDYPRRSTRSFG